MNEEQRKFQEHSIKLYNWSVAELFYIFTTCNLIQTNDQRTFCRARVLSTALRVLHAEYYWLKYIKTGTNAEFIYKFMDFKTELSAALMDHINRYALVSPLEVQVFGAIAELEMHFDDTQFYMDEFMQAFKSKINGQLQGRKNEMDAEIKAVM